MTDCEMLKLMQYHVPLIGINSRKKRYISLIQFNLMVCVKSKCGYNIAQLGTKKAPQHLD